MTSKIYRLESHLKNEHFGAVYTFNLYRHIPNPRAELGAVYQSGVLMGTRWSMWSGQKIPRSPCPHV